MKPPRLLPPHFALLYLAAGVVAGYATRGWVGVRWESRVAGALCILAGFGLMTWAWALFYRRRTAIRPTDTPRTMVTGGPYRFTRNPMYAGIALMLLGFAFLFGDLPVFLAPVAFLVTMNRVFVPLEERNLETVFGEEYRQFARRVRRWV